jgi:hypothetical protein
MCWQIIASIPSRIRAQAAHVLIVRTDLNCDTTQQGCGRCRRLLSTQARFAECITAEIGTYLPQPALAPISARWLMCRYSLVDGKRRLLLEAITPLRGGGPNRGWRQVMYFRCSNEGACIGTIDGQVPIGVRGKFCHRTKPTCGASLSHSDLFRRF